MTKPILFHNPDCSKSRATLALLDERKVDYAVRLYLELPLDLSELQMLTTILEDGANSILREADAIKTDPSLNPSAMSLKERLELIANHPNLMQRPILMHRGVAKIGRPPESVLSLLDEI